MALSLYCDACGSANRAQAIFCFSCGQRLHSPHATNVHPIPGGNGTHQQTGLLPASYLLKQRYRVLMQAGKGGFGAVYKAVDVLFGNRLVAIKEMSQQNLTPQELTEATSTFKHEALLLANLIHPNLPRIYEQFAEDGRLYLVMDFIEGEALEEYMLRQPGGK